jgi:hypothetical protein
MLEKWQDRLRGNCRQLISALCKMARKDIAIETCRKTGGISSSSGNKMLTN